VLAQRFQAHCFTPLELYSLRDVFTSLANSSDGIHFWREETFSRFLELPDSTGGSPVLFQMVSYLAAFPFPSLAPAILDFDGMIKNVVIFTGRYSKIFKKHSIQRDRARLFFRALAVYDRGLQAGPSNEKADGKMDHDEKQPSTSTGFAVDEAVEDDEEDENEDGEEELALAALDALDAVDVFKLGERSSIRHSQIPTDNFRRLIMLLLVLSPLHVTDKLSQHAERLSDEIQIEGLRRVADNILWSFNVEKNPGIYYHIFDKVFHSSLPYLFDGLGPLFEHFLFSKNLDLSKKRGSVQSIPTLAIPSAEDSAEPAPEPLLSEEGEILDLNLLSQLSFFIHGSKLFRRLRLLYSGSEAGFSLGSFETKVVKWTAPTIFLVSGSVLPLHPKSSRAHDFTERFVSKKYQAGASRSDASNRVVFGVYLEVPWKASSRDCFGNDKSLLFQLEPVHEVFRGSTVDTNYAHFHKSSSGGISFGCTPPRQSNLAASHLLSPGPVSLMLDDSLEFGVFTHDADGGGSYHASNVRRQNWQTKFEIDSIEVWGIGGSSEVQRQKEAWAFEEREALLRRNVNLGKDVEADRALLEMAGLMGNNRSGGSMG
jgi:hypothetical protein